VLACQSSGTIWQRGMIATKNMFWIAQSTWDGHRRPNEFRRPPDPTHIAAANAVSLARSRA
jgi:hypothetical protein